MEPGLYESLVTRLLSQKISAAELAPATARVDDADVPYVLARHIAATAERVLTSRPSAQRLELVARLLEVLEERDDDVVPPPRQLLSLLPRTPLGHEPAPLGRPATPLTEAALLTNARGEPGLGAELRAEMGSADDVSLLCAFVKWHGLRLLEAELTALRDRQVPLRVITTTYMGATERRALDRLVRDFGGEVRIQYDADRTRLHAKAWLFERRTGFATAYVGSSNLSRAALLDGVEWNVRLSQAGTPSLLQKFRATFETYWNDPSFESYDPDRDGDRLDDALGHADAASRGIVVDLSGLDVRPYAFQQAILDAVAAERLVHGRHRNLVVAATGTGKTVIAALDYLRLCAGNDRPTLLFVAHRREILEQSLRTYREVLKDASFGELWFGDRRPERGKHVFASIQSIQSHGARNIPADAFDIVVIDEFHHAQAPTYRRLIEHLTPVELLGLTATPERTDGLDVRAFFDGRTAAELRLWDALENDLLTPFHYFGVADNVDLAGIKWTRGRYDEAALSNVYTGNDARAALVIRQVRDKIADLGGMRALGFCVGVAHARYMAQVFADAGIPARALSGETSPHERKAALDALRSGAIKVLFAADLLNEGVDLPDVDTVLFLRPTESATIFLQQLGRGLRRTATKPVLTALDFVGHHRKEFRFDLRFRALTGATGKSLRTQIEHGFPFLPSGTRIVLDEQTQQAVLESIRAQLPNSKPRIIEEIRAVGDVPLAHFLDASGVGLSDILRTGRGWTAMRRAAGVETRPAGPLEETIGKRARALAHVDDAERVALYRRLLLPNAPRYNELTEAERAFARMLYFSLFPSAGASRDYTADLMAAGRERAAFDELGQVVDVAYDSVRHTVLASAGLLHDLPLRLHAHYQREEALAGLGWASLDRTPKSFMEGVLFQRDRNLDAFFITVRKSEADFSPTTMYRDYPISTTLLHWESQSTTSLSSPTGRRYVDGTSTVVLFVRVAASNDFGTAPYTYLGPAHYVKHEGERPIAITWRLDEPMPAELFAASSAAVA
ncbi:MAG TPA: DUF3427 domain-containing protein [Propionicimonas sp.]|jgi:superfamily II DNA or RNA helicase/HKD family nuclease